MDFYRTDKHSALDAKFLAQQIAFAPMVFQAAVALRDLGVLAALEKRGKDGASAREIADELGLSEYGVKVLAEAGLGMGLLLWQEGKRFTVTKTARFIQHDAMTRANMDFVRDVNYQGFAHLKEAIETGKPAGLKVLGDWETVYEGLASLPPRVRQSWLAFDHFYSDSAFAEVLPIVFRNGPKRLLDVGGNTGKWTLQCLGFDADVQVTIADLPGQLRMAEHNLIQAGMGERVAFHPVNLLDGDGALPGGHDIIWMSQFLDCFSQPEVVSILQRAAAVMGEGDELFILEAYWDRQEHEAAAFCLQQTSLYFTCIANGNSQMYHSDDIRSCVERAGLEVIEDIDRIGISHTLFRCRRRR
jgi:hypothetical protein